jgi:hypothetical protein
MLHVLLRRITLLVCLLGFMGVSTASDHHEADQAGSVSKNVESNADGTVTGAIAEEFKAPGVAQVAPADIAVAAPKDEQNNHQEPILPVAHADIKVIEFVLTNKVEGRQPKDVVENFNSENGKGFAFAQLSTAKPAQVTFIWSKEGKEHSRFTTHVHAAKRWRTYSSAKLRPGHWKVQLVVGDQVLAERAFTVQ